ncbi:hypothetical protein M885DRAFT_511087 [Pelagophyceae sp. CCMP2097]|nr:hypothetical protein M885DRAFT_511087 [Pelagophyceae sp. CCMP2097]
MIGAFRRPGAGAIHAGAGGLEPGAAAATAVTRVLGDLAGAHPRRDRRPARSFAAFKAARGADAARRLAEARRRLECARRRAAAAAQSAATLERQLALDLAQLSAAPPCSAPPPPPPPRPPRRRSAMLAPGLTRALRGHECRPLLRERVHNGTCAHRSVVQALERYHQRCAALEAAAHDLARAAVCLNPQLMSHNTHLL